MRNYLFFFLIIGVVSTSFAQKGIKLEPFFTVERGFFPKTIMLGSSEYESASASTLKVSKSPPAANINSSGLYLSAGAMLEKSITKRASFRVGIAFANRHIRANDTYQCVECSTVPSETVFRVGYIDIPLAARYYLIDKRFTLYTDAGLTTSGRVYNETVVELAGVRENFYDIDDAPFSELMLMAQVGFGGGIKFKNGGFNLSTVYRNGLTKFAATDNYRFKSLGLNVAFYRTLN